LCFIPKSAHHKLRVRALPMGDENKVNLFFVDMLAPRTMNALLRLADALWEYRKLVAETKRRK
jgi:hypothetical protein